MTDDVGVQRQAVGHIHSWERGGGPCVCGQPVPSYLRAAWHLYEHRVDLDVGS